MSAATVVTENIVSKENVQRRLGAVMGVCAFDFISDLQQATDDLIGSLPTTAGDAHILCFGAPEIACDLLSIFATHQLGAYLANIRIVFILGSPLRNADWVPFPK
jgi:hypothetical protein